MLDFLTTILLGMGTVAAQSPPQPTPLVEAKVALPDLRKKPTEPVGHPNVTSSSPAECPAVQLIAREEEYLPVLLSEINNHWADVPWRSVFGAQIRQETCAGLKSKKCWSPYAELKTDREYGFGLGQVTVTKKFDNFHEAKKLHSSMKDWTWENRYNAEYQLRTMILMDRFNYSKFDWAENEYERMAFAFAAYNGGIGGVLSDRRVCGVTGGCDLNVWFHNVENTSKKAKVAANGYGQSFFQINRTYVMHVMGDYSLRYKPYFDEECSHVR